VVQGNRRVEAENGPILFQSRTRRAPRRPPRSTAALKALYASGLFDDVHHHSQSGGHIIVTVVESPVINRLAFEGNHRMKDEQLQGGNPVEGARLAVAPRVQADTQRIVEVYHRNGRFDVTVVPQIIERPNNRVDLVFVVNEGEKTGVKEINFVGNKSYSSWRLKEVIKTAQIQLPQLPADHRRLRPDRMEADRDLIRRFYLKHGFADVQVVSAVAEYDPAKKGFNITFTIEEGPLTTLAPSTFNPMSCRRLAVAAVGPAHAPGRYLQRRGDRKTVEQVTIEVARRGYPFATVRPRGDRNPQTRTIKRRPSSVDEGTRAYIERINIHGNIRTRDYVIRREFDIAEGDPYNRALMDRAERRLKNLNFFKSVKITNEPGSAPDRVVINVELEEQSTGDFSIMGGYSTAEGWLAQMSVSERNLLRHRPLRQTRLDLRRIRPRRGIPVLSSPIFPRSTARGGHRSVRQRDAGQQLPVIMGRNRTAAASNSASRCAKTWRCNCAIRCTRSGSRCRPISIAATTSIRISLPPSRRRRP